MPFSPQHFRNAFPWIYNLKIHLKIEFQNPLFQKPESHAFFSFFFLYNKYREQDDAAIAFTVEWELTGDSSCPVLDLDKKMPYKFNPPEYAFLSDEAGHTSLGRHAGETTSPLNYH